MSKFPKTVYVVIDEDSSDTLCDENPEALIMPNQACPMARYVLAGEGKVVNATEYVEE